MPATKTSTNGSGPNILNEIVDNIPDTEDEVQLANYLRPLIAKAAMLPEGDLLILEPELRAAGYRAGFVRSWLSQVKKHRRQQKQQTQQAVPSHADIADIYIGKLGETTMYARNDWHRYENGVWSVVPEIFFEKEVLKLLTSIERKHEELKYTRFDLKSVTTFISRLLAVPDEDLDKDPALINMQNGVFDARQQLLLPHDPLYYQTTQLPFEYDGAAQHPIWDGYLKSTLISQDTNTRQLATDYELIKFLQESVGYSLTSSVAFQIMFWLIGEGANGKGVFIHVLRALAGDAAMPLDIGSIGQNNTYQLAMMAGKKIAYSTEAERNADMVSDGLIKSLVSGDPIMVRQIREKPFELRSTAKLWWSMNRFPKVSDTSHGFWRRVKVIPFNRIFAEDEIIPDLQERLTEELPGIFNWAMVGLQRVLTRGFTEPAQVQQLTKKHKTESNPVQMFVDEETEQVDPADNTNCALISELFDVYKQWCHAGNYRPLSRKNFKNELESLGYYEKRISRGTVMLGLKISANSTLNSPFSTF